MIADQEETTLTVDDVITYIPGVCYIRLLSDMDYDVINGKVQLSFAKLFTNYELNPSQPNYLTLCMVDSFSCLLSSA